MPFLGWIFLHTETGFSFADAIFKLEREELKCVNQGGSLCITSCHAQRDTLPKAGEDIMMSCRLSSADNYAEGMVEGKGIDPNFILVARSLSRVSKK